MNQTTIIGARAPEPLPLSRVLRAYLMETKFEIVAALRMPGFALPFIAVPVAVYLLFAVVINGNAGASGGSSPGLANYLFSGFSVMAVMMPGIFSGVILATDREGNVLKLKRALPAPPGATIVAKVLMAMGISAIAVTLVAALALYTGKLTISTAQIATIWGVLILGTIPFAAIGLLIGSLASSAAAPAYGNLIFLPMLWLSGLFIPLPAFMRTWVVLWPAFHLNQLALGAAGVSEYIYIPATIAAAVLTGVTVLCGGIAIRRLARVG